MLNSKMISGLFLELAHKYGRKYTSTYPTDESTALAKLVWAKELRWVCQAQVDYALDIVTDDHPAWPPEVGEFKGLCLQAMTLWKLPTPEDAWRQCCRTDWDLVPINQVLSHGVVLAARMDSRVDYNWFRQPFERGLKKFIPIYIEYLNRSIAGEVFEIPKAPALEDRSSQAVTPEEKATSKLVAGEAFAQMLSSLGRQPA
jgi:hypothetical protein